MIIIIKLVLKMEPVRCISCGKPLGNLFEKYKVLCQEKTSEEAANELKLTRICCRTAILTSVSVVEKVMDYNAVNNSTINNNPYIHIKK